MKRISETDVIGEWSFVMQWQMWGGMENTNIKRTLFLSSTVVSLQLEAKRCFIKLQRELLLYERMKYIVSAKIIK